MRAFDTMGNKSRRLVVRQREHRSVAASEAPVYLRVGAGGYAALEKALAEAKATNVAPVAVTKRAPRKVESR